MSFVLNGMQVKLHVSYIRSLKCEKNYQQYKKTCHVKILNLLFSPCFNRYVISAPKVFCVGASETVVIQVYGYMEAFDATISIKSYPDKKISYSSEYVSLTPENKFQNSATLTVCIYFVFYFLFIEYS